MYQFKNVHHITAGAGAGKTTRIVDIITKLVSEGAKPERMILTTFTDAAATELREKSKAKLSPDDAVRMNGALMGTLHSIASRYINRYWYLLGLSPNVRPVSESISDILMNRSLEDIVTGEQKALFNKYVETFGITDRDNGYYYDFWKDILKTLLDKIRKYEYESESEDNCLDYEGDTGLLLHYTLHQGRNNIYFEEVQDCFDKYRGFKDVVAQYATEAGKKTFETNCSQIDGILALDPYEVDIRRLKEIEELGWGRPVAMDRKKCPQKDQYDSEIAAAKEEVAAAAKRLARVLVPAECELLYPVKDCLFKIMDDWPSAYEKVKREAGVIDYTDMEAKFLTLLGMPEVQEDIRASVDYLFVDEFQDSNPIQARIYSILSTLIKQSWFVGDRKQAIYGFAGSDAGLIAELVASFPKPEKDENSLTGFKKDEDGNSSEVLDTSRRSTPKLVRAANEIFVEAFKETLGDPKDVIEEEHVRLKPDPKKVDTAWNPLYHVEIPPVGAKKTLDAEGVATFVCTLAGDPEFVKHYRLDDIAILTRTGSQATNIGKALVKKGIPTSFVDPKGFLETPEVSLVLAILRLSEGIDREKSRAEIRKLVSDEGFTTLADRVAQGKNDLGDYPALEGFAKMLRAHSVPDRINEIVTRFDLVGISGQWGNPDARRGSLNLLRQAADEYADKSAILCAEADVRGFLSFLKDYKADQKFDNSAGGVKVLTYHKSKGLDWKIVILCGLDEYKEEHSIGGVTVDGPSMEPEALYVLPPLPDKEWVEECVLNTDFEFLLRERQAVKRGEEKRLLYVGFTRAKEVVITVATSTSPGVIETLCPTARNRANKAPTDATHVDIWGIPGLDSRYGVFQPDPDLTAPGVAAPERYKEAGILLPDRPIDETVKYRSPSKYKDPAIQATAVLEDVQYPGRRTDIPHNHLDDNVFGDCIHHIFARCTPGKHDENLAVAASTLKGYGIQDADAPEKVVAAIEGFFLWLEEKYDHFTGLEREVPFQYTDAKGQVFSGNMDLVWRTANGCVLVDYKTFPGNKAELFNPGSKHWAGNYASQLSVYADALSATPWGKPLDRLLYYPVEGMVIRVKD